CYNEGENW
nr:immunoglobulin heavy chain junction region [Macaca mulatta]MPN69217.1 immunoglobulin heavy chain junction region [Macaca mulatta]MPN70230.1 immunoglobulin heavy chain junction region [Macaca mulatta]MPN70298.1 immunoglobulin heavy chain junction region [Macaca mulatta]MPN70399.1 immunoglobulin heavy chain junction region [Macaca mulatta]